MRIDRLHVKNFRGFEDRTFDFPRSMDAPEGNGSFHVIIGQNGKGKTSALEALAVAAGSFFLGVRGAESRHIQPGDIRIRVLQFGDTERIEQQLPVIVEASGRLMYSPTIQYPRTKWKRELRSKRTTHVDAKDIKQTAEGMVIAAQAGLPIELPLISYYGTGRLWQEPREMQPEEDGSQSAAARSAPQDLPSVDEEDDLATTFGSRLAGYRHSIDPRCSPRMLLRWLKFEQQLAVQQKAESAQFRTVKEAIKQAVEGCEGLQYHLRLGLLLEIAGQPRLPFSALSDGQRNVVAMVGDLAYKAAQLNPHLGPDALKRTPGIVLIDELDLHLHPIWQRHIVEVLRHIFPEVQFIASTHSPFIIQELHEGELIPLDAQPVPETANLSLEAIAGGLMGVEHPETGTHYREMVDVAKEYLVTLEEAKKAPAEKLAEFTDRLAQSIARYADNPAYQASLEMKRVAGLGK